MGPRQYELQGDNNFFSFLFFTQINFLHTGKSSKAHNASSLFFFNQRGLLSSCFSLPKLVLSNSVMGAAWPGAATISFRAVHRHLKSYSQ